MYQNAGFTLIELLAVVLILGVLASVALPQYRKAVLKARAAEGVALLHSIAKAQDIYFMANGQYTTDLEALDLDLPKFTCRSNLCQFVSPNGEFLWEITFNGTSLTHYSLYCAANTNDEAAKQVCASYGGYTHINIQRSYYRVLAK